MEGKSPSDPVSSDTKAEEIVKDGEKISKK